MVLLNIETSTTVCSASITVDGVVQTLRIDHTSNSHARLLPVFVQELLEELRNRNQKLDAVALSQGPGSYTGLRIGSATAKGLCYGFGIPLVPVDTLLVIARMAVLQNPGLPHNALLCPMIDARRMEVYNAFYTTGLQSVTDSAAATIVTADTFSDLLSHHPVVFCGNGADKCKTVLLSPNALFLDNIYPSAEYMGQLAESLCQQGKTLQLTNIAYYNPFYLKEFQATVSRNKVLQNNL